MSDLGVLVKVPLREAWAGEASDFTPWLCQAQNLALLSKTINIDLELVKREVAVGDYRLDILAQHVASEEKVVIENQFGQTDHSHLGQLLTYAAGIGSDGSGARTVIWIAERFNDSHRSALDWLNKCTEPGIRFFGVELELWRIGTSLAAPRFSLVSKPNDWQKKLTQQTSTPTDRDRFYIEYWETFKAYCTEEDSAFNLQTPGPSHYLIAALGRSGVHITFVATRRDKWIGCELTINDADPTATLASLSKDEAAINLSIPGLVWEEKSLKKSIKLYVRSDFPPGDRKQWPIQHQWLLQRGNEFYRTFEPRFRKGK